jgi:hypothetical protein
MDMPHVAALLLAPDAGMAGAWPGLALPVAAWPLRRDGRPAPGAGPLSAPLDWLRAVPPEFQVQFGGGLVYRSRRAGAPRSDWHDGATTILTAVRFEPDSSLMVIGASETRDRTWAPFSRDDGRIDRVPLSRNFEAGWIGRIGPVRLVGALGGLYRTDRGTGPDWPPGQGALALETGAGPWRVAGWWRRGESNDGFALSWKQDAVNVAASGARTDYGLRLVFPAGGGSGVLRLQGTSPAADPEPDRENVLLVRPRLRLGELAWRSPSGRWSLAAGRGAGTHRGFFETGGARFGRVLAEEDRWWLRTGWHESRPDPHWAFWAGYTGTVWDAEGSIELWPFTPTTVDLLGQRRYVTGDARLESAGGGVRFERPSRVDGAGPQLRIGFDLLHVWGDGLLVSWEPFILGLGRQNVREDRLEARSAQLAGLGVEGRLPLGGGFALNGGFSQLVPVAVQYRERKASSTPPPEPPPVPPAPAPRSRLVWSGLRWSLGLTIDLGPPGPGW